VALALLAALELCPVARAEDPPPTAPTAAPTTAPAPVRGLEREMTISLVTYGPGEAAWERFGHNGIWVRDPAFDIDRIFSFGYFDFRQAGFFLRFLRGRMLYSMEGREAAYELASYVSADRSIWIQELSLTDPEKLAVRDQLLQMDTDQNRHYRYDYYADNCSTRIRDVIDRVLDGELRKKTENEMVEATYRSHTRRLTAMDPWLYTGLLVGLGNPIDRPLSLWGEMFLPGKVRERVAEMQRTGPDGRETPLVRYEHELHLSSRFFESERPPGMQLRYLAVGMTLAGLIGLSGIVGGYRKWARWVFATVAGSWTAFAGVVGAGLAMLWLFTDHATSYGNENLFFLTPLALPLPGLILLDAFRPRPAGRLAIRVAAAVAISSLAGLVLQILPGLDQVNGEVIATALPPNLALAALLWFRPGRNAPPSTEYDKKRE